MANTTLAHGLFIEITGLDANWVPTTSIPDRLKGKDLAAVLFTPSAANDKLILHGGSATGPRLILVSEDGGQRKWEFPPDSGFTPYMVVSECTFGTAANAAILLQFHP
jgi:hypothetical protein